MAYMDRYHMPARLCLHTIMCFRMQDHAATRSGGKTKPGQPAVTRRCILPCGSGHSPTLHGPWVAWHAELRLKISGSHVVQARVVEGFLGEACCWCSFFGLKSMQPQAARYTVQRSKVQSGFKQFQKHRVVPESCPALGSRTR